MRKLVLCLVAILFSGCVTTKSFNAFKAGNSRDLEQLQANQENLERHIAATQATLSRNIKRIDGNALLLFLLSKKLVAGIKSAYEQIGSLHENEIMSLELLVAQLWKNCRDMKKQIVSLRRRLKKMEDETEGVRIEKNTPEKPVKK